MADAVAYLSRVADDAGMDEICADLLVIEKRLASKAEADSSTGSGFSESAQGKSRKRNIR
ncbi:MAG TPA: hypothetical protein VM715_05460 [Candidatus Acidoferrum sp.]|nr:hypothetical protein [Candidatus Acidoferrum sp.]